MAQSLLKFLLMEINGIVVMISSLYGKKRVRKRQRRLTNWQQVTDAQVPRI
jgi:hypothetical protein